MPATTRRRALATLDQNADLQERAEVKRPPISFDQENEHAVQLGIAEGIYTWGEIAEVTNRLAAARVAPQDEDADEPPQQVTRAADMQTDDDPTDEMIDEDIEEDFGEEEDDGDLGVEGDYEGEVEGDGEHEEDQDMQAEEEAAAIHFDPAALGLKEINNLAHFGVSSHKPGNGVEEMLSEDLERYWQSDGQQPHTLTIHFLRRVEIRAIRFYVDFQQDESYTPTHIIFRAGTGPHDLLQFTEMALVNPAGWQDVPIDKCGGGADGHSLCCWIVQMHIRENHQNGKDTHVRGIRIFALDDGVEGRADRAVMEMVGDMDEAVGNVKSEKRHRNLDEAGGAGGGLGWNGDGGFSTVPNFMRDPEIR